MAHGSAGRGAKATRFRKQRRQALRVSEPLGQPGGGPSGQHGRSNLDSPLTGLLAALALAALGLLLLRLLADLAWRLVNRCIDPAVERVRSANDQERVQKILAASLAARQRDRSAARALAQRLRLTDLNGQPLHLAPEQIPAFHNLCCRELGVPTGSPWPRIRQQWRRQSLRWHPDHGGDTATWLRKQRAYEALELLRNHRRNWLPAPLPPLLAARRSRRLWPFRVER